MFLVQLFFSLNFTYFLSCNRWIIATYFFGAHFTVIESAIMLVTVAMYGTKETTTTARETS